MLPDKRRPPGWPVLEALAMIQARLDFLRGLSNWWIFKNGWSDRIAALRAEVAS